MNCYNHPENQAVAICKYCQKGLCQDCTVELECGMSCKEHTEKVKELDQILAASQQTNQGAGKFYKRLAFIFAFFGLVMIAGGLYLGPIGYVMLFTGLVCLSCAGLYFSYGKKRTKKGDVHR